MKISTKGRYALRAMVDIATHSLNGEYIPIKDISKRENISIKYLEQVIALLVRAGFLQSLRGNNGGYRLMKKPSEYTAGDIIKATEGTLAPIQCLACEKNECDRYDSCSTIKFWEGYYDVINNYVNGITLQDLVDENLDKALNYSI